MPISRACLALRPSRFVIPNDGGSSGTAGVAVADSFTTAYQTARDLDVLANDVGTAPLIITSVTQPASGTVAIINGGTKLRFTPANGFSGALSFTYTMQAAVGGTSTVAVQLMVQPQTSDTFPPIPSGYAVAWQGAIAANQIGKTGAQFMTPTNLPDWAIARQDGVHGAARPFSPSTTTVPHYGSFNAADRVSIAAAPDGSPAIENRCPYIVLNWWCSGDQLRGMDVRRAIFEGEVWIDSGFQYNPHPSQQYDYHNGGSNKLQVGNGSNKLGAMMGCWIGNDDTLYNDVSGGSSTTTGCSVRTGGNFPSGPKLYSYHLNRPDSFGQSFGAFGELARGRWVRCGIEVDIGTSSTTGRCRQWRDGAPLGAWNTGLDYGASKGWFIRGGIWNDMWGGTEEDFNNMCFFTGPNQKYWFRNFRILVLA